MQAKHGCSIVQTTPPPAPAPAPPPATAPAVNAEPRVRRMGAWNLKNPGTYVQVLDADGCLVIGNRPGVFHYLMAIVFPAIAAAVACMLGPGLWPVSGFFVLLFGVMPVLPLLNRQRFEVAADMLRARGKALGFNVRRDWPLPEHSAVRVEAYPYWDGDDGNNHRWTCHQAQILTGDGWVGVAELLHDAAPVTDFARQMAQFARVPFVAND